MLRNLILTALAGCCVSFAGVEYTVTDIGTFGGTTSFGYGLSSNGYVTGTASNSSGATQMFLWENGTLIDITPSGSSLYFSPTGVNSSGVVAGYYENGNPQAFVDNNGSFSYPSLGGSYSVADGINDQGQVTGYSQTSSGAYDAYIYQNGTTTDLTSIYGQEVNTPRAIANSGEHIAGAGYFGTDPYYTAFLFNGSSVINLGTLGGSYADVGGVSSNGLVTGWSNDSSGSTDAYYTDASHVMHTISGTSGGSGNGINSSGQVVGTLSTGAPFLYSGGVTYNLNTLLATSGWTISTAVRINDSGEILADASNSLGQTHAVLLTPFSAAPEPASIGLITIGMLAALGLRRKRSA